MAFRVEWKKSTRKDLRKLPASVVTRIIEAVENLAETPFPHGVEKLSGSRNTPIASGWATTGLFMKSSRT